MSDKPVPKKARTKHTDARATNFKRLLKLLEQRQKETPLLEVMKRVIEKNNQVSYQNEYVRLRNLLHTRMSLPAHTKTFIEDRKRFLKAMGAKDVGHLENTIIIIIRTNKFEYSIKMEILIQFGNDFI